MKKKFAAASILLFLALSLLADDSAHAPAPVPSPELLSLKVLTYNIQMLPRIDVPFIPNYQLARASLIPTVVSGYDVIVFEEAFGDREREVILYGLAAEYPYHTRLLGKEHGVEQIGQEGGVVIVSKWPIEREFQAFFRVCAEFDCLAQKGVMYARLNVSGKPVHIFGTHAQAGDDHRSIRQVQLGIIRSLMESMAIPANHPVLIAGDLNVNMNINPLYTFKDNRSMAEYNAMLSILAATHPEPQSGVRGYTRDPKNSYVPDDAQPKYLDYVLYSNNHLKPDQSFNDVRIFKRRHRCGLFRYCDDLSDHYAVEGNFTFSGVGTEGLGTFPFVVLLGDAARQEFPLGFLPDPCDNPICLEESIARREFICNVSLKYETQVDFAKGGGLLGFTGGGRCTNDEASSLVLYDVPAGRVLRLFDDSDGNRGDDWVEIIAKRNIAKKIIVTLEQSFEDDDVRVNYHSRNGLPGIIGLTYLKVSRLEVDCLGGCNHQPTLIAPGALALSWREWMGFTVNASDVDADQVEILTTGLPAGATLSPTSGTGSVRATVTWRPGSADIGEHTITFVAKDGRGAASAAKVTTISVTSDFTPPPPRPRHAGGIPRHDD
jgi:endonuclease/exonuclease/phosphatase family metal-dependent hydrolase